MEFHLHTVLYDSSWLVFSVKIIFMKTENLGVNIQSAITCFVLAVITLIFVDGGNFPTTSSSSTQDVVPTGRRHQEIISCYATYLNTRKGALKPEKLCWYPLQCAWENEEAELLPANKIPVDRIVTGSDENISAINNLDYI